jgi:hypothetical protein
MVLHNKVKILINLNLIFIENGRKVQLNKQTTKQWEQGWGTNLRIIAQPFFVVFRSSMY